MTVMVASRPLIVREVTTVGSTERGPLEGFALLTVGLGIATRQLGAPVASFDDVEVAVALADTGCCPLCRSHARDGARVAVRRGWR
jgi:hypothetical protein